MNNKNTSNLSPAAIAALSNLISNTPYLAPLEPGDRAVPYDYDSDVTLFSSIASDLASELTGHHLDFTLVDNLLISLAQILTHPPADSTISTSAEYNSEILE